ncbi:MAG: hypothetical protein NT161_03380, partial [Candidatus Nomurabacteria bacterium]|nr:hypothetical protein [Candidatus Nomurabacteria bacterium]
GILSEARKYRLNLTVAHQYTAQLVTEKNSSVRDAIFGNVGTMIVFRVGADDAEFLEKEFEPEFTPQDIVNLPNFKVYLKLMIDGVSSRPFSAKTIPPMVKSGNKKVEEEVINSSRALYCRSREVVEREINDWSDDSNIGGVERFPTTCDICKKDTTVPFKPELGRAVYCKDCIAKIKSGEIKPIAGSIKQIKQDETLFYKPLADLGIEFKQKDGNGETERYPERIDKPQSFDKKIPVQTSIQKNIPSSGPKIFSTIKKVFTKSSVSTEKPRDNTALREILNKTLNEEKKETNSPLPNPSPYQGEGKARGEVQPAISLNELKNPKPSPNTTLKDRSASKEDMDKLKDLISQKAPENKTKEVPEDVLRKILE